MKLLFSGGTTCNEPTLKCLLLVAEEIGFMDRPSVTFPKWGTIGMSSPWRNVSSDKSPVKISVYAPPSGPVRELYKKYIEADFTNPDFKTIFLDGFTSDVD